MIVTDVDFLRARSELFSLENDNPQILIESLRTSLPSNGVGLAAPQIGILKRVFIANLSIGEFAFINPILYCHGYELSASKESCLSLPGTERTIYRSPHVLITADRIYQFIDGQLSQHESDKIELKSTDAFIVQHETDHLDGILITDHKNILESPSYEKYLKRVEKRNERNRIRKHEDKSQPVISSKIEAKSKKQKYKERKKERKKTEIFERYLLSQQGIIDDESSSENTSKDNPHHD